MNGSFRRLAHAATVFSLVAGLGACSWFTDFKEQPKLDPWESTDSIPMRGNPQNSVSVYGSAAPGFAVSRMPMPATLDSMKGIANPVPADARSLANGRMYYQINCAVCHGEAGGGFQTSPMAKQPVYAPPLGAGSNAANALSDGYIWAIMRNGRGAMPPYNRIEELDRWDVVNYVRGLQGKYQVVVGPTGLPGETGNKVPGYSQMGPTRPSPYWVRAGSQAGPGRGALDAPVKEPSTSPTAGETGTKAPSAQHPDSAATVPPVTPASPHEVPGPTTTPHRGGAR
jgi:mono/diheme cytochrome c family protein